jgi:hypothetical protein
MMQMRAARLVVVAVAAACLAALALIATLARADTQMVGTLVSSVQATLSPKKLPRSGRAPVSVQVDWKVSTTDGSEPPTLKKIAIEINRNGILDPTGLPACPYSKIQPASTQRALSNCRSSLVGKGSFSALAGLEGQERYLAKGKMIVFNAVEGGKPVLFGQIYSAYPFANSFVIVFKVKKAPRGTYGTTLTASLPANLRAWGNLTAISMRLSRNYSYEGKRRSFLSAGCPAPKGFSKAVFGLARTSFAFDGGPKVTSTITGDCTARG